MENYLMFIYLLVYWLHYAYTLSDNHTNYFCGLIAHFEWPSSGTDWLQKDGGESPLMKNISILDRSEWFSQVGSSLSVESKYCFLLFFLDSKSISISSSPTDFNRVTKTHWLHGFLTLLEMAYIKMGQRMIDKSMHGAIWAVHVLVDHPRDEVWSEGDDKCL